MESTNNFISILSNNKISIALNSSQLNKLTTIMEVILSPSIKNESKKIDILIDTLYNGMSEVQKEMYKHQVKYNRDMKGVKDD